MDSWMNDPDMITIAMKPVPSKFWGFYCGFKKQYPPLLRDVISEEEFRDVIIQSLNYHKVSGKRKAGVISAIILSRGAYNPTRPMFYKKVETLFDVVQELNNQFNPRNVGFKIVQTSNKECLVEIRFKPVHLELVDTNQYQPKEKEYDPYPLKGKKFSKLVNY
ncbi:hypothetical protein PPL_07175 [Heterostelium album PN500]|uniref:Uncharacterized protein n=1 Tax=Heterostelium pallidum (strain ATCC 26659 / Pp 5 / PN500) TaxID=670386 RepID=D3BEL1_HETP5|nr:hypothetical protein PPL_07175 [Heterostelium album PN500]EFA80342.1 hypothetical protein PPL_07175 [Heterostelium album PN500]|eukprot:XP_020432462.1 hypothetical protein PPL_07175 [Heterostelium album PN500]